MGLAGVDEVGRGAWFGPVVAAAVLVTPDQEQRLQQLGIRDSKQLSASRRSTYAEQIRAIAADVQVSYCSPKTIDRLNILQATLQAMRCAVHRLCPLPEHCLVDGNQAIPYLNYPQETVVKGDQQSVAIAAASIVAKVWRDELIVRLAARYTDYDLAQNKGYGTPRHRAALAQRGPTALHRLSFRPCQSAYKQQGLAVYQKKFANLR